MQPAERKDAHTGNPDAPQPPNFQELLTTFYDMASGGIGVQLHAINQLARGEQLEERSIRTLKGTGSNVINQPYVWAMMGHTEYINFSISAALHDQDVYRQVIADYEERFRTLNHNKMRQFLGGDGWPLSDDPISIEELDKLISEAKGNQLLEAEQKTETEEPFEVPSDITGLIIQFPQLKLRVTQKGIDASQIIDETFILQNRQEHLKVGLLKLGVMLLIMEQVIYDAQENGIEVKASYKPEGDTRADSWQKTFGHPLPSIGQLYSMARDVITYPEQYGIQGNSTSEQLLGLLKAPFTTED